MQSVKIAVAAMAAWLIADRLLHFGSAFLAPYTAVFMVDATVFRSFRAAAQQVFAVGIRVVLAMAGAELIGSTTVSIGLVVLVGFTVGRHRAFGSSGFWVGVTALLMVTYGTAQHPGALLSRVALIVLGAGVGLAVNALVFPPTYVATSRQHTRSMLARLRELFDDMAEHTRDPDEHAPVDRWHADLDSLFDELAEVRGQSSAAGESAWLNLRPSVAKSSAAIDSVQRVSATLYRTLPRLRELIESLPEDADGDEPMIDVAHTAGLSEYEREQIARVLDDCAEAVDGLDTDDGRDPPRSEDRAGGGDEDRRDEGGGQSGDGHMSMSALPTVRQAVRMRSALTAR